MGSVDRRAIGIWAQWPLGARWSNEGMTRLLGFLIEGIAQNGRFVFRIVLPDWIREEAESDLLSLKATAGLDYSLHSPLDDHQPGETLEELADYANGYVDVECWLSIFPQFRFATRLEKPLTVIFPDAIPKVFHEFSDMAWGFNGNHSVWESYIREVLASADHVVVFSRHVRDEQLGKIFGISADMVTVVPHAPPDLAPTLPFVKNRARSQSSLAIAAEMLREIAVERDLAYLYDFPFEEVPYIAISTQDRVTKNNRLIVDAALRLIRDDRADLKIISTAPLHFGADWTPLPGYLEGALAKRDLVSMTDLPRDCHAALLHCAVLTVHASLFEGGHAPFPFYESISVGTPCLMAHGPHMAELIVEEPGLSEFVFDPNDAGGLAQLIKKTVLERESAVKKQRAIFERLAKRTWADVSLGYAEAAISQGTLKEDR